MSVSASSSSNARRTRDNAGDPNSVGSEVGNRVTLRGWLAPVLSAVLMVSCTGQGVAEPTPQLSPPTSPSPGRLTLDEEIGAVIMAGLEGAKTGGVAGHWT